MVKIIVIFPFVYMDNWYMNRYKDQLHALADNCTELNVVVNSGVQVDFNHDKINVYYNNLIKKNQLGSDGKKVYSERKSKELIKRISFYNYWGKLPYIYRLSKKMMFIKGDIILGYSGAGWQELYHNLLGFKKNIPSVHRMRGYGKFERSINNNIFNRCFNDALENISYKHYDYHIPITRRFRNILIKHGINKKLIGEPVGLGVNTDLFKSTEKGDYIGYVGRLTNEKGVWFLKELVEKTPDVKYLFIGSNDYNIKLPDNVTYVGKKQKHDVPKYMDMCKAILLPSKSEGISNTILETYSMGKILLCSQNAIDKSLPLYGYMLDFNINNWINAIYAIDTLNTNRISIKARQWALENSWSAFGKKMTNSLKKVIKDE